MVNSPWIQTYVPNSSSEVLGQSTEFVKSKVLSWTRKSKPIFLWGQTGTGKTVCATSIAKDLSLELVDVNASDSRNAASLSEKVGGAISQGSLFGSKKIILIDEVDGLSGVKDRGAIPSLIKLFKNSLYPIIITGENPFEKKFSALRKVCELIEFKPLDSSIVANRLSFILSSENISFVEKDVKLIARSCGGDLRAAINDLQSASSSGKLIVSDLLFGERERKELISSSLLRVFKTTRASLARGSFDLVNEDINKIMLWIDQNLPSEYSELLDLKRGFDALAEADKFLGRIRRWQYYRFYVYAYDLVTAGIAIAKDDKYKGLPNFKETTRLLQIWMAKQKNAKKLSIAEKISDKCHCSKKRALDYIPFLQYQFIQSNNHSSSSIKGLISDFDFSSEEVSWLVK